MSDDPRRTGFCTPTCYRECQCSRWLDMVDRWGNPVNHGQGGGPWWLSGGIAAANCLAAYTAIGAASLAASYDNNAAPGNGLADGTYDAALGIAPAWAAGTGWTFDGATTYLQTGIIPAIGYSAIVRFSGLGGGVNDTLFGELEGIALYFGIRATTGGITVGYYNGGGQEVGPQLLAGNLAISGQQGYRNGVADGPAIGAWGGVSTLEIYIGAWNAGGAPLQITDGSIQALAIYGATITAPQITALVAAMAAL